MISNGSINKKRIAKNIVFLYIKVVINMILSLFTTRIILRELGVSDYGIYGIVAGTIAMFATLNFALAQATQRYMSYAKGKNDDILLKKYFNTSIIIHIVIGVFVLILMELFYIPLFNGILNIPESRIFAAKIVYHFMILSTIFSILTVPYDAAINAHEDLVYYSLVGVFESILRFVAALVISFIYVDRLIIYGALLASISILLTFVMRRYCFKRYSECVFIPKKFVDKTTVIEMSKFAGWNFMGSFSSIVGNYGTTLLINHFFGVIVNAAKSIADQLCSMVGVFSDNMMKAFNPVLVKQEGSGNRKDMINLTFISCRFTYLMYSFIAIPFCLEMPFLLRLWLKNIPEWAVLFCQLQILRTLLEQMTIPIRTSLMARGCIKYMNLAVFLWSCLTFIILYLMYLNGNPPYWHFIISILFLVIMDGVTKLYLCKKYCEMNIKDYVINVCGRCVLCTLVQILPGLVIIFCFNQSLFRLLFIILACSLVLICISCIVGLHSSERNYLFIMLKKLLNKMKLQNN
ncbi:lipopolysaccharide biosynthesis protein [Phocaeicola coprophilus]|jgi:O-antigen/teichoic acid export membrane protein|uniref:lipopolysaccharide biosynthesis protein n=1 Tax=Phocaeicola coprophilus TaxID=387090 RepID=UPI00349FB49D